MSPERSVKDLFGPYIKINNLVLSNPTENANERLVQTICWSRITQLERLRVRHITLATRQTFAADQSSSIVAFFVLGGFLETLHVDLDTDLVAEFEAVGDGFCWIEHANDCPCNPVPILYIYTCLCRSFVRFGPRK